MFEITFFDLSSSHIRKVYTQNLDGVIFILSASNVDFEEHFVKVRFVKE